jgi:tRNA A37 threonylcarbamoyladenosine modification protein TsaB
MDAHRGEVFAGLYQVRAATPLFDPERLVPLEPPLVAMPADAIARSAARMADATDVVFIGDGAVKYADVIAHLAPAARIVPPPPLASAIGRLAYARARRGGDVDPAAVNPLYVRRPDAELARDRRVAD